MTDSNIKVNKVGKKFCKSLKRSMFYGMKDIIQNAIGITPDSAQLRQDEFWAVDGVDFELKKGETFGIIGPNGSGKTTLLKMLNGIFMPDKGQIEVNGRVGALIQVGAGFHPMLTGRENIYINGTILGMSKKEIDQKISSIIDFADIGDFLDSPVKYYSSGMYVRLGFAVAIHCAPDILLIDEILAVGDSDFQMKCYQKMTEIKEKGTIILLVSHNEYTIREETDRCLYIDHGKVKFLGSSEEGINLYIKETLEKRVKNFSLQKEKNESKDKKVRIIDLKYFDSDGKEVAFIDSGSEIVLEVACEVREKVVSPIFGVNFYGEGGFFYCANNKYEEVELNELNPGQFKVRIKIPQFHLPINNYLCSVVIAEERESNLVDWHNMAYKIGVGRPANARGSIKLKTEWSVESV